MHLTHEYALLRCEGVDALRFLQGQLSADITTIMGQQGGMACDINLKGRVMAAFYIYAADGGYHLIVPRDQVEYLLADLKKYAVFSKVTLSDLSDQYSVSPQLSSTPQTAVFRYQVLDEPEGKRFMLTDRASFFIGKTSAPVCPMGDWFEYLIEHDIPTITVQARDLFLPHYIGLVALDAVSFDKGCYKGQEVVARMHYRAKIKKHIAHTVLVGEHEFKPGDSYESSEVVNAVVNQGNTYVLLINSHTA